VALNPSQPEPRGILAQALLRASRPGEAAQSLRAALAAAPGDGDLHWSLALALRRLGDAPGAKAEAATARALIEYKRRQSRLNNRIDKAPGDADAYLELARLHMRFAQPERALGTLTAGIANVANPEPLKRLRAEIGRATGNQG
jgi:Flp pilus assembly protein TadD